MSRFEKQAKNIPPSFLKYARWAANSTDTCDLRILATTLEAFTNMEGAKDRIWKKIDVEGISEEDNGLISN